jgi:hypothetical protein
MFARVCLMAFVWLCPTLSLAQLPSQHFSSINFVGRYLGFGYSDGYHSCKDGRCTPSAQSRPWDCMSSFYGAPTLPPNNRIMARQEWMVTPGCNQGQCSAPTDYSALHNQITHPMQTEMTTTMAQPNLPSQSPQPAMPQWAPSQTMIEPAPQSVRTSPSDRGFYESVPSAPRQLQPATREREQLDLPSPLQRSDAQAPEVQSRRVPPGAYSLIQPTSVRAR